MAHGYEDFRVTNAPTTTYQMHDLGENVARLGFINTFDRRGDLVWQDDFEASTFKWTVDTTKAGSACALNQATARNGAQCVALTAPDASGESVILQKIFAFKVLGKIGVEWHFTTVDAVDRVHFTIRVDDETNNYWYFVEYHPTSGNLRINTPAVVTLDTFNTYDNINTWNAIKMVIDSSTNRWARLMFNDRSYDVSAYSPFAGGTIGARSVVAILAIYSDGTDDQVIYADDFILTQNEP